MERRRFLQSAGAAAMALGCASRLPMGAQQPFGQGASPLVPLPADFAGLGYEMSSAATPGLLSPNNTRYVNLVQQLGRAGVLRFGGIVADFTSYRPEGAAATGPKHTVVNRAALQQLRAFLDTVGWRALLSVNFGQGTLPEAIAEARDVASLLGDRLFCLELGNEVDNYGRGDHPLRKPPYTFHQFRAEYTRWHDALAAAVPGLRFAAPDTAESIEWLEALAADAHGSVQLLTTHYYRNAEQRGNAQQLEVPDPALRRKLQRLRTVTELNGLPWRLCEANSFSGGGLPGVSNTLLGALWTLDFMMRLASGGCAGVNLETGVNQLGFVSSYSPIQDDGHGFNSAGAPYYGMLAFAQAAAGSDQIGALQLQGSDANFSAYRFAHGGVSSAAVLVNRSQTAMLRVPATALLLEQGHLMRLEGKDELSDGGLKLAGAAVQPSGAWAPQNTTPLQGGVVEVPPMSAALVLAR